MLEYLKQINEDITQSYVSYILANYGMPTLLRAKPSNLINVNKNYIEDKIKFFHLLEKEINQFGSNQSVIYENDSMYLIMIYNSKILSRVFQQEQNKDMLTYHGYEFDEFVVEQAIDRLKKRYQEYKHGREDFPHEMGIMLGYPIEDVEDFIKNHGQNYKFCGLWKVYNDVDKAVKVFEYCRMLREDAIRIVLSGKDLNEIKTYYKI